MRAALTDAAARLHAAGARTEALAEYEPASRVLLLPRAERLRPVGRVWRLGALLLEADLGAAAPRGSGARGGAAGAEGGEPGDPTTGAPDSGAREAAEPPKLYATGSVTRSHEPGRPTYQAASAERRRQLRVAAYRGHFTPGESVNYDATPIAIDDGLIGASGAVTIEGGRAFVRWSTSTVGSDALSDFETYLADRVALLVDPPAGA